MPPTIVQTPQAPSAPASTPQAAPQPQTPSTPASPVPQPQTPATPEPSLLQRLTMIPAQGQITQVETPQVTVQTDDLKDPQARQVLENRLKEANLKISKTFGEIGAEKAKLMKQIEDLNQKVATAQTWTPQRLQEELRKTDFVQSAQTLQAQVAPQGWEGSHEEWSALSDYDKQRFNSVLQQQNTLSQQMNQLLLTQVDAQLKTKYPDYDSTKVDSFIRDASEGRVPPDQI